MTTEAILERVSDETGYRRGRRWFAVDPFHAWAFMPRQLPGVYAYTWGDDLIYIGQSRDLRTRIRGYRIHAGRDDFGLYVRTPWGLFRQTRPRLENITLRIRVSESPFDWLMHEQRLIGRTRPRFNRAVP